MLLSFIELLCWSIQAIFPECRQLDKKLNAFNRIADNEMYVIIVRKAVWICETIITHFAQYPRIDADHIEHFVKSFYQSLG